MTHKDVSPECASCSASDPARAANAFRTGEEGIGRRTFIVQSGILAAMAALAACAVSTDATAPNVPSNTQINLGNYPALASVGGVAMVTVSGAPLAIVRTSTSTFLALSRVCPHQGGIVSESGSRFVCPVHGATFDLNGNWIGGQPTSNLHQYTTTYDATTNTLTVG